MKYCTPILLSGALFFSTDIMRAESKPDPITLIQGVASNLQQIPPSSLKIHYTNKDPFLNNQRDLSVDFDGEKRRFINLSKLRFDFRTAFDGSHVVDYATNLAQAEIRSINDANLMLLFDPRIISISPYFQWTDTIEVLTRYGDPGNVELMGSELIGTNQTWHIRVTKVPSSFDYDLWIDVKNNFRVYRHDMNGVETYSYYENPEYPWLPSRVEAKEYNSKHQLTSERDCEIVSAKAQAGFSSNIWSLAGLNLPPGTPVINFDLHQRLGYWDGGKIVQNPFKAAAGKLHRGWMFVLVIIFLLSVPLVYFWGSRQKSQ